MSLNIRAAVLLLPAMFLCLSTSRAEQAGRRLFVVGDSGEITEYDPATWAARGAVKAPAEAAQNPESLAINASGQMLLCPTLEAQWPVLPRTFDDRKVWFWDGKQGIFLDRGLVRRSAPAAGGIAMLVESRPRCALSSDGQSLFWFENETATLQDKDELGMSVTTTFRAWQSDLGGKQRTLLTSVAFPSCKCDTGTCSETCPEAAFWFPETGVRDYFLITQWIPGQLGSTYQSSSLFRRSENKWPERKLPETFESVEDSAQGGTLILHTVPDGGCCGWENVSSDLTLLNVNGKEIVLFDEFKRFGNPDYDVSFFASSARLSPDAGMVAMTISATARPGADIRLSDQGKSNPAELARIRKSISDLPAVEVLKVDDPARRSPLCAHATLAGWLNDSEILVIENGLLTALNPWTAVRRTSRIKVAKPSQVFVR